MYSIPVYSTLFPLPFPATCSHSPDPSNVLDGSAFSLASLLLIIFRGETRPNIFRIIFGDEKDIYNTCDICKNFAFDCNSNCCRFDRRKDRRKEEVERGVSPSLSEGGTRVLESWQSSSGCEPCIRVVVSCRLHDRRSPLSHARRLSSPGSRPGLRVHLSGRDGRCIAS